MSKLTRRDAMKGAAATMAVVAMSVPAAAASLPEASVKEVQQWTLKYVVRYLTPMTIKTDYEVGENVTIKLLKDSRDRRKFAAQSLEQANGKVIARIPANAVPWRYVQNNERLSRKLRVKLQRSEKWQKPGSGLLFVVGIKDGIAIVPAHRMRSRELPDSWQQSVASAA